MKVRIGFSTTDSWISKVIRLTLKSEISHTYIRIYDSYLGIPVCIHSELGHGVRIQPGHQFDQENRTVDEFEIENEGLCQSIRQNMRLVGRPYDNFFLFKLFWTVKFRKWAISKIIRPLDDPKKLICVEWITKLINDSQMVSLPKCIYDPQTLREWCINNYQVLGWKRIKK
jgi:hypothetical protein